MNEELKNAVKENRGKLNFSEVNTYVICSGIEDTKHKIETRAIKALIQQLCHYNNDICTTNFKKSISNIDFENIQTGLDEKQELTLINALNAAFTYIGYYNNCHNRYIKNLEKEKKLNKEQVVERTFPVPKLIGCDIDPARVLYLYKKIEWVMRDKVTRECVYFDEHKFLFD